MLSSPVNTNICWLMLLVLVLLVAPSPVALEDRSRLHGTGTSFSPLVAVVEVAPPLVAPLVPEVALELNERIAKSTRPELGLRMTSLIVPRVVPEELLTLAPISLLARNSFWLVRPVAPILDQEDCPDWLPLLEPP